MNLKNNTWFPSLLTYIKGSKTKCNKTNALKKKRKKSICYKLPVPLIRPLSLCVLFFVIVLP